MTIYRRNGYTTIASALVDTGAEARSIYGNPKEFRRQFITITGLGRGGGYRQCRRHLLKIGQLPKRDDKMTVPVPEYIIVIDILKGLKLARTDGIYQFGARAFQGKTAPVIVGKLVDPPVSILRAFKGVQIKQ